MSLTFPLPFSFKVLNSVVETTWGVIAASSIGMMEYWNNGMLE
jgi:hypothetical protein